MQKLFIFTLILILGACTSSDKTKGTSKKDLKKPYEIIYKTNIPEDVSFVNQNKKGSSIEVDYIALGTYNRGVRNIRLVNMERGEGSRSLQKFENVDFPFWGKLFYNSNKGQGAMEFKIFEKGYWVITLKTLTPQ
ncbi:MAG: hypothetical protein K9G47_02730 [Bacteroidales bacterium]|nr:hypothetical protein [Bacteroidales bacterium]